MNSQVTRPVNRSCGPCRRALPGDAARDARAICL
jgi:hypothetical protein